MADAATINLVQRIVYEKVTAGAMFTAFDVTQEARSRGAVVRHQEVRDIVHNLHTTGAMGAAYKRTPIDVGAGIKPFLYHRYTDDPKTYRAPAAPATPPRTPGPLGRLVDRLFGRGKKPTPPAAPGSPPPQPPRARRRGPVTLGLDAGAFRPISSGELHEEAKHIRLGGPWFGRRDLIPPADDPRTKLIDRAMVTGGLLTPEQLVEIHRIGAEMDRLRPEFVQLQHQAAQAGAAAVQADRAARAKLKERKKAEAAERRRRRAEEIARRRATDILYLGRGVSGRLGERTSDTAKLQSLGLPVLATPANVAAALELTIPQLRWLAFHIDVATRVHYVQFTVPKRSGGTRTLSAPHRKLAAAQFWILNQILAKLPSEEPAHGFLPGRSILTNARPHAGKAIVLNMDLEGFFPSITFPRVRSVFHRLGYSPAVATILALLCTECPRKVVEYEGRTYHVATGPRGLPQGACTSPALSNQVARRLDKRLAGLARKLNVTYTRYADDLTFSGDTAMNERVGYVMARVRHLAKEEGFAVNEKKSRILRRNSAQAVTGLVVNDRPGVPRDEVRRIRAILHRARTEGLEAQNRDKRPHFRAWLLGMIAYIGMARPEVGAKLKAQLEALA